MTKLKYKKVLSTPKDLEDLTKMINAYFYSNNYTVEFPHLINAKIKPEILEQYKIEDKNNRYSLLRRL